MVSPGQRPGEYHLFIFMKSNFFDANNLKGLVVANWRSGLTVALISVPLSIALSIASGAGPLPGLITGIWATLIASFMGGSNYNIIGAAGALTTVLFAATLAAPLGLGAAVLPLLALATGFIILLIWLIGLDKYLYLIPSSVMYGFAAGVAFLIAASQLFDATGLSALKRTGHFLGDLELYIANASSTHVNSVIVFAVFLAAILLWKKYIKALPAVIPVSIVGIIFGYLEAEYLGLGLISLGDKFGSISGTLMLPVAWTALEQILANKEMLVWVLKISGTIALIAVLETLITAKIADKITKKQSSSRKELFGLALANLGSGAMGGLPATGVFIRTGANIKAGATHKMSATIAAVATAVIALAVLPFFIYIPMVVIAAILVNTALGLIEIDKFKEFYVSEKPSFLIAVVVVLVTVFEDAGMAVALGAIMSLFWFTDQISRGRFDAIFNFADGTKSTVRSAKKLDIPGDRPIKVLTYSISGLLGYIDSGRHADNFRRIARAGNVDTVIIRLRGLLAADFEGQEMLGEAVEELEAKGKTVYVSSASEGVAKELKALPQLAHVAADNRFTDRTEDALKAIGLR